MTLAQGLGSLSIWLFCKINKKEREISRFKKIECVIYTIYVLLNHPSIVNRYERLLRRARTEDLSEVSGIGCLYQSGVDRLGRPVVVFIGKWFPISDIDLDKVSMLYIPIYTTAQKYLGHLHFCWNHKQYNFKSNFIIFHCLYLNVKYWSTLKR